ncbi:hypothetical protein RM530_14440 [Algiphilus sp. W345]|uniref:Uncharacterized protein n=1 Tax=Banduia mediterranea TaxID=3075609 RepID=A0ABU2WKY3_9GAMM|nr:hypothetical protein [Algiphilus sp. W345]MDT0498547.1 hypothetical protein [Algiphilus sp. W345]
MKRLERLEWLKDTIQDAIDRGATSVEQVHQYIAELPFEALEKSGLMEHDRFALRDRQRRTIGMVYNAIRTINAQVGALISDQFENLDEAKTAAQRMSRDRSDTAE